jgi:hypothetical protein
MRDLFTPAYCGQDCLPQLACGKQGRLASDGIVQASIVAVVELTCTTPASGRQAGGGGASLYARLQRQGMNGKKPGKAV